MCICKLTRTHAGLCMHANPQCITWHAPLLPYNRQFRRPLRVSTLWSASSICIPTLPPWQSPSQHSSGGGRRRHGCRLPLLRLTLPGAANGAGLPGKCSDGGLLEAELGLDARGASSGCTAVVASTRGMGEVPSAPSVPAASSRRGRFF